MLWSRNLVAKSEAKDSGTRESYWWIPVLLRARPNILLIVLRSDVPQTSDFCGFLHFKRAIMEMKLIYFIRICFSASTRSERIVFSRYRVSKYEFFAVSSTSHFKLLLSWLSSKFVLPRAFESV